MYLNFNITYTDRIFISFVFLFNFNIWYLINILKYNTSLFIDIEIVLLMKTNRERMATQIEKVYCLLVSE